MSNILSILKEIKSNSSSKNKLEVIKKHSSNETLKKVFLLAYSKNIKFRIKKTIETSKEGDGNLDDVLDFMENQLAKFTITGHAAIDKLRSMMENIPFDDQEVVNKILKEDLEIGASSGSANKVWKNLIKEQPQMLANPNSDKNLSHIKYPAYAQLKADGARCFAYVYPDGSVEFFSRSGKSYNNLKFIEKNLSERYLEDWCHIYQHGVMVDGEIVSYVSLLEANSLFDEDGSDKVSSRTVSNGLANKSLAGTLTDEQSSSMVFEVWDLVDLNAVLDDSGKYKSKLYDERLDDLTEFSKDLRNVKLIETTVVNNIAEAKAVYRKYVDMQLEGIILKNIKSAWENKRSKNLVKFKEVITVDLMIEDSYLHNKDPKKIGGFTLVSRCKKIRVDCGSGLSDTDSIRVGTDDNGNSIREEIPIEERSETNRARLFTIRDQLPGLIVEVECNGYEFSQNWKEGDTCSLFLGTFQRFRHDKNQANTFEEAFGITFEEAVKNKVVHMK